MARQTRIYWLTPATIVATFLAGIFLALVHHLFYESLEGSVAPTSNYHLAIGQVSKQQVNIAAGTAFAFMVKSMLSLAVTISHTQAFWRQLRSADNGTMLADVDTAFSALRSILLLFKASVWRRHSVLLPIAVIFW
jgi:hypothetical protein